MGPEGDDGYLELGDELGQPGGSRFPEAAFEDHARLRQRRGAHFSRIGAP